MVDSAPEGPHPDAEVEEMVRELNPSVLERLRRGIKSRISRLLLAAAVLGVGGFGLVAGITTYLEQQAEEQRIQREEQQRQNHLKERSPSDDDIGDFALA